MATADNQSISSLTQQESELGVGYWLALIWDYRKLVSGVTAGCLLIGAAYALLDTPVYRANALLQIERQEASPINDQLAFMMGQQYAASNTQMEILQSRMIMTRAAEQAGLDVATNPKYFPVFGSLGVRLGLTDPPMLEVDRLIVDEALYNKPMTLDALTNDEYVLKDDGGVEVGRGQVGQTLVVASPRIELLVAGINSSGSARFTVIKRNPEQAAQSLRNRFRVVQRGGDTGILELSLTGTDRQQITHALNAIAQVYLVQNINRQAAEAESRLAFLEEQAPEVRESLAEAEENLNLYRASRDSVDLSLETQSMLQRLVEVESQLNEADLEEADIQQQFTRSHPSYRSLLERKQQLQVERTRLEDQIANLPETQQQVLRMTRDVEVNQQIYMQMLNTIQELRIARAGTLGNVRILDEALVQGPIRPQRGLIMMLSLIGGGFLSVLLIFGHRMLNRGIESVEELHAMGMSVYATVPLSDEQAKHSRPTYSGGLQSLGGMLAWNKPEDPSIEALRGLRTSLHFAMLEAANNCLMITGVSPSVGKSFVSANLAAVCAKAGQKVLLVDADLRKGHLHTAFGNQNDRGLSGLLSGRMNMDEVLFHSEQDNLHYVPRGVAPPNPSELLMHKRFTDFLEEANKYYDLVVIDTPPILAVTDAALVGKQVGTSLMVVRFQKNTSGEIGHALHQLENTGVKVAGCIFNAIEHKASSIYSYGNYSYTYRSESP